MFSQPLILQSATPQVRSLSSRELHDLLNAEKDRLHKKRDKFRKQRALEEQSRICTIKNNKISNNNNKSSRRRSSCTTSPLFGTSISLLDDDDDDDSNAADSLVQLLSSPLESSNHYSDTTTETSNTSASTTYYCDTNNNDVSTTNYNNNSYPYTSIYTDTTAGDLEAAVEGTHRFQHNDEFIVVSVQEEEDDDSVDTIAGDDKQPATSRRRCIIPLIVTLAVLLLTAIGLGIYFVTDNNNVALPASASTTTNNNAFQQDAIIITGPELAAHNTSDDCWVLIGTTVYDLTGYAPSHPGGSRIVTDLAGTDATRAYEVQHPQQSLMRTLLSETIVGTIADSNYQRVPPDNTNDGDGGVLGEVVATTIMPSEMTDLLASNVETGTDESPVTAPVTAVPVTDAPVTAAAPVIVVNPPGDIFDPPIVVAAVAELPIDTAFISEIHYDNIGSDEGQFIEIAYRSNQLDMSGYKVEFYRGNTGLVYNTESLQTFAIGASVNGLTFASRNVPSFHNGIDGVALVDGSGVVAEFISYEGTMTAGEGYAAGMTSTEIGAFQTGRDPIGWTLQKAGTGCRGDDFTWGANAAPGTPGDVNAGMTVACYDTAAVPAPETLSPTAATISI